MNVDELKATLESEGVKVTYDPKRKLFDAFVDDPAKLKHIAGRMLELGLDHVKSVTGVDYPDHIEVIWHASSYSVDELKGVIVALRVSLKKEQTAAQGDRPQLSVDSLTGIWPSALFLEREAHEMFGINFVNHPDLRPILLSEDFYGKWPLRKDFTFNKSELKVA